MTYERKRQILSYLTVEIEKVKPSARKADEASKFTITGPSQSGDKYHAQNTAKLIKDYLRRLETLMSEIKDSKEGANEIAKPVSFLVVHYKDGNSLSFVLVQAAVSTSSFLFISHKSPLGNAVLGKRAGDEFSYALKQGESEKKFLGKIIKVE